MKTLTLEEFHSEYPIYEELAPDKPYRTLLAMKEHSDGSLYPVVLKEMDEKKAAVYRALCTMWNPYTADTYDVFQLLNAEGPARFVAVTEYVCAEGSPAGERMSLTQFVLANGPLPEPTALFVCAQLCRGLREFHQKGFVHRDLKPDNVMIAKYDLERPLVKIIDFGSAKAAVPDGGADTTVVGTLGYQPPESLASRATDKADIYSIGCILNFMLTGQEPGITRYRKNHYIRSILEKATNEDPSHRYSNVQAMQKEVEHELRTKPLDRIPLLRSVPGFRTHTLWKEILALVVYISLAHFLQICWGYGPAGFAEIFFFYIVIPLIVLCNMGDLLRFFPESLRQDNRLFLMIRISILLASFFGPMLFDYVFVGS